MTPGSHARLRRNPRAWVWVIASLPAFGALGIAAILLPAPLVVGVLTAGAVGLAWLVVPQAVIVALLLLRSSVDGIMELFTLFPGSSFSMNLSGATNSLAVGLGLLTVVRRLSRRQPVLVARPGRAFALFLLVGLLSIPGSVEHAESIKEWARLASGLAIYLMVADTVHDERDARRLVAVLLASSAVPLAVAWLQKASQSGYFFLGFVGTEFAYRPQGTFVHPAALGSYLVILLTLAMGVYFSMAPTPLRVVLLAWGAAAGGALVFTLARAQWLGMMAATMVLGLIKKRWIALLALAAAAILLTMMPLLAQRVAASESIRWREDLWRAALSLAWPLRLLGRGLGTAHWHINQILPKVDSPPHNDYLKIAIEVGLLGSVAFGIWLLFMLRHAWRAYRRAQDRAIAWRALGLAAVVLAGAVMSVVDNYLGYTAVQWYLWALAALVPVDGQWPKQDRLRE